MSLPLLVRPFQIRLLSLFFGCALLGVYAAREVQAADLAQDFTKPSAAAKAGVLWMWMDGNISKEGITADLEAMARVGIGRALIFNVKSEVQGGPAPFFSPQWFDLFHFAVSEAERLGLEISFHNCAGYSSSGGPWIKPQNAAQIIVVGEVQAQGGTTFDAVLPQGKLQQNFHRDISVLAFPTPTDATRTHDINKMAIFGHGDPTLKGPQPNPRQVPAGAIIDPARMINLTDKMDGGGRLRWEVPAGNWTILRIGHTGTGRVNVPSPGSGQGLECDKLSREAMDVHWVGGIQPILDKAGPLAGKILNVCHIDSYEAGGGNWTPLMQEEFKKRRGYDLVPFLPAMTGRIVGSSEITERFLWDLRRTISDLFAENYYGHFAELCHKHGLQAMCEPYDGPFEGLQVGAQVDLPMAEFWADPEMDHSDVAKLAASIAHTHGTTLVPAESFTSFPKNSRWTGHPAFLKGRGDAMWCEGINRFELHTYAHQPWTNPERSPGMTMSQWGTQFGRCVTWWEQSKAWFSYLARSQQLLQSGQPVEDVLVFGGEAAPNCMLPYRKDIRDNGWDYALVGTDQIGKLTVRDGCIITPAGGRYRLLVLPDTTWMTPALARPLRDLVQAGAAVLGPKPQHSPSLENFPACDDEVRKIADAVWGAGSGERRVGQGRVFSGMKVEQVLAALDVKPDFVNEDKAGRLKWIHRVADGADVYFISNQKTVMAEAACAFRISGRQPELWHPDTGVMEKAPVFREKDGTTTVPLKFDPMGSLFVVFRQPAPADPIVAVKQTRPTAAQAGPELKIVKAEYGAFDTVGMRCCDVTAEVKKLYAGKLRICAINLAGRDPAPNQPKELFVEYTVEGSSKQMKIKGNETMEFPAKAEIVRAIYGVEPEKNATIPVTRQVVDITERLNALVKDGEITVRVDAKLAGVDPAPAMPKKLRVEYSVGGSKHVCVVENHPLFSMPGILCLPELANASVQPSAFEMGAADDGKPTVLAWQPVTVELTTAAGKKLNVDVAQVPSPVEISGVWELAFPPNWGAPDKVALEKLISWTEHANSGVKYFSGTASYRKTFESKAVRDNGRTRVYLDLGKVKNIAEVRLDGKELGILWKPPFRVEVTGALRDGKNELEVRVTNLWPNRLIGDEQLPEDRDWHGQGLRTLPQWVLDGKPGPTGRFTLTTFHHWTPFDEPLPSGLLGPVLLRTAVVAPVEVNREVYQIMGAESVSSTSRVDGGGREGSGVEFVSDDPVLQRIFDAIVLANRKNIAQMKDGRKVLVEGDIWRGIWLETQPMGGSMYGKFDLEIARNNLEVVIDGQLANGMLPHMTHLDGKQWNGAIGFNAVAQYGLDAYYLFKKDPAFLDKLENALTCYDAFLWKTRDRNGNGVLEAYGSTDTGEDGQAFNRYDLPRDSDGKRFVESVSVMADSYANRAVLAQIAGIKGDEAKRKEWQAKADALQQKAKEYFWVEERKAAFDRNAKEEILPALNQLNIRAMTQGLFTQQMADDFIGAHLMNPSEFFTPYPIPSTAVNDPTFHNVDKATEYSTWAGPSMGLTLQRSVRALENYGHYTELGLIGKRLLERIGREPVKFPVQFNPLTGDAVARVGAYGPMVLATMEYLSRMHGVYVYRERLVWNGLPLASGRSLVYTQKWFERTLRLDNRDGRVKGYVNATCVFDVPSGLRVESDDDGHVLSVAGIAPERIKGTCILNGRSLSLDIAPNQVQAVSADGLRESRRVPFVVCP